MANINDIPNYNDVRSETIAYLKNEIFNQKEIRNSILSNNDFFKKYGKYLNYTEQDYEKMSSQELGDLVDILKRDEQGLSIPPHSGYNVNENNIEKEKKSLTDYNKAVENHMAKTAILNTKVSLPAKILQVNYDTFVNALSKEGFAKSLMPFIKIIQDDDLNENIPQGQKLDPDYFVGGSEEMFYTPDKAPIEDVIKTFQEQGIYKFKLNDNRINQLIDYLKNNNINYAETSQLGSDITVFDPEKFPKFMREDTKNKKVKDFILGEVKKLHKKVILEVTKKKLRKN